MRTLSDLHDRLRAYVGNDESQQKSAAVYRAAMEAVLAMPVQHDWNYYATMGRITTSTPYSTGTIEYDYTGGAYERMVTLSGGTWPSWVAGYGTLTVSNIPYDIDKRISDTIVTLKATSAPADDIVSGTSYLVYRARYDLPSDFQTIRKPIITGQNTLISKFTLEDFVRRRNLNDSVALPFMFCLVDNGYGRDQILFWNPPDLVYQMEFEYKRKPVAPVVACEQTGTVTLTASSTTVTGTATQFTSAMAGAVLRVGTTTEPPTSYDGINPPVAEYLIDSVTNATTLVLVEAPTATLSSRGYTISSRVDVRDGPMFDLLCEIGQKNLRIALRITMTNEELPQYERTKALAKSDDGQRYAGTDTAIGDTCRVGMGKPSYMRTVNT